MIRASFSVVKNKLADSKCGCGSSFSVLATTNSSLLLHGRLRQAWVTDLQLPVSSSPGHTHFFQYWLHSNRGCKSIIASNPWHYLRFCVPHILVVLQACDTEGNPQQLRVERKYGCCSPFGSMMFPNKSPTVGSYIYWLVVYLPLWKIWKSVGSIIPNIWKI